MNYPPIDPHFYEVDAESGMTDAEIEEDWHAYIDGLNAFHAELEKTQAPMPDVTRKSFKDVVRDILAKFAPKSAKEPKHAAP